MPMKLRNMVHNYAHRGQHCRHKVLRLYRANGIIMRGRTGRVYKIEMRLLRTSFTAPTCYLHVTNFRGCLTVVLLCSKLQQIKIQLRSW